MPGDEQYEAIDTARQAGYVDVHEWAEKDIAGAYPPGTIFTVGGRPVDVSKLPDHIGADGHADRSAEPHA